MHHPAPRHLYRSNHNRMLAGVAGSLAAYVTLDPTVVRVLVFLALMTTGPFGLLGYALLAVRIPPAPTGGTTQVGYVLRALAASAHAAVIRWTGSGAPGRTACTRTPCTSCAALRAQPRMVCQVRGCREGV
jgi:phage shock protein PspC (stress-responsive transcriptional regulator)